MFYKAFKITSIPSKTLLKSTYNGPISRVKLNSLDLKCKRTLFPDLVNYLKVDRKGYLSFMYFLLSPSSYE